MSNEKVADISWGTILKVIFALLFLYLLYLIKEILIWVIFALIISILFNPAIDFLQKKGFPRSLATVIIYVLAFSILGLLIYWFASLLLTEVQQFSQLFPQYFEKFSPPLRELGIEAFESFEKFTEVLEEWLRKLSGNIFSALVPIFGGLFSAISILSLAIFFSLEEKCVERAIFLLSPKRYENFLLSLWEKSQQKVGGWFRARILSCIFVGILSFLACYVLNIKYALSFGLLAGVLDIVPIVGPIIAGAVIVIFTFFTSVYKSFLIFIIFLLIQLVEGNILTPLLSKKFVGLSPVIILISLLIGGKLWGALGAVLTIPLSGILFEFLKDFLKEKKELNFPSKDSSQKVIMM